MAFKGGVDLLDQRLPGEPGYLLVADAERMLPAAFAEVLTWPDSAEKEAIIIRLDIATQYMVDGQRQLLFSPNEWVSIDGTEEPALAQLSEVLISLGARNLGAAA